MRTANEAIFVYIYKDIVAREGWAGGAVVAASHIPQLLLIMPALYLLSPAVHNALRPNTRMGRRLDKGV